MNRNEVRVRALREVNGVIEVLLVKERAQEKIKAATGEKFIKRCGRGLPGGGVDVPIEIDYYDPKADFTALQAEAQRELLEETGRTGKIGKRPLAIVEKDDGRKLFVFAAYDIEGELKPLDKDILAAEWVPIWQAYGDYGAYDGAPIYRSHTDLIQLQPTNVTEPQEDEEMQENSPA